MRLTAADLVSDPTAMAVAEDWCRQVGTRLGDDVAWIEALPDRVTIARTIDLTPSPLGQRRRHVTIIDHAWPEVPE